MTISTEEVKRLARKLSNVAYNHGQVDSREFSSDKKYAEAHDKSEAALTELVNAAVEQAERIAELERYYGEWEARERYLAGRIEELERDEHRLNALGARQVPDELIEWSCDQKRGKCRNPFGCHCAEIESLQHRLIAAVPKPPADEQLPIGMIVESEEGEAVAHWFTDALPKNAKLYLAPKPAVNEPIEVERAFDLGFEWRQMLMGHVHDGRDVARTLTAPMFDGLRIDATKVIDLLDRRDTAIVKAKAAIKTALLAHKPQSVSDNAAPCEYCNGYGQVCTGTSGSEQDGNAPVFERCPSCGYGDGGERVTEKT